MSLPTLSLALIMAACSSSSTSTAVGGDGGGAASDAGAASDGGAASATPGAELTYTVNGTAVVADKCITVTPGNGMDHITLGGTHYDAATSASYSLTINLYNTTGAGTYKCSDNALGTAKQGTNLTYNTTLINSPDRPLVGDCLVTVTGWATKSGEHYIGTFSTSGVPKVDITNGVFDLTRP